MALLTRTRRLGLPDRLRWWHVLVLSLLGGAIVGAVVYFTRPGAYRATSALLLNDQPDVVAGIMGTGGGSASADAQKSQQDRLWAILGSREIRSRLVKKYQLADKFGTDEDFAIELLAGMTMIKPAGGGLSVTVTCFGYHDPRFALWAGLNMADARQLCADVANSYLTELDSYLVDIALQQAKNSKHFVRQAQMDLSGELRGTEDRLQALQNEYELLDPEDKAGRIVDRIKAAEQAYADASAEADDVASSLHAARAQLNTVDAMHVAKLVELRNPVISQLEQKLAELRVDMATELESGKTAEHRDVAQIQAAIDNIEKQIENLHQEIRQEFSRESNPAYNSLVSTVMELQIGLAGSQARKTKHASLLGAAHSRLAELPPVVREYATLKRQQEAQSELIGSLTQSIGLAMIEEQRAKAGSKFVVLDTAVPPIFRSGPPTLLSAAIGFVVVFVVLSFFMIDRRMFGMY